MHGPRAAPDRVCKERLVRPQPLHTAMPPRLLPRVSKSRTEACKAQRARGRMLSRGVGFSDLQVMGVCGEADPACDVPAALLPTCARYLPLGKWPCVLGVGGP